MDLTTKYLGLELPHPFMSGASPLVDDLDTVRRLEDAGAAAIVMHSLFEEQIAREHAAFLHSQVHSESFAEALYYFPPSDRFPLGPEEYLAHLARVKRAVACPVIASLNGTSLGGWLSYARAIEQAGADALELNVYSVPTDLDEPGSVIERRTVEMVREVKRSVAMPVAVKLSPFYTSLPQFLRQLEGAGADGFVLFNRLYQPDIDPEHKSATRQLPLSRPEDLPLRLRWLALLSGRLTASLAVTGGVHSSQDAIKALMCGAHGVQMVTALLREGPHYLAQVRVEAEAWMVEHEYESLEQMRGSMNMLSCPDPTAYERANYMLTLQSWRGLGAPESRH